MNKEFERLLAQITELENSHRRDEARFLTEQLHHQNTSKELQIALSAGEQLKANLENVKRELSQAKASLSCEKKINQQLKQAVRNAKHENQLLREHTNKVVEKTKQRREEFLQTMARTNQALRELRDYYSGQELPCRLKEAEEMNQALQKEVARLQDTLSTDAQDKELQALKEQLEQALLQNEALNGRLSELNEELSKQLQEKLHRNEEMEAAVELIAQLKARVDQLSQHNQPSVDVVALTEELAQAKSLLAEQKAQLAEKDEVARQTIAEFQELDLFTNNLATNFEHLQVYCSALEGKLKASSGSNKLEALPDVAMEIDCQTKDGITK